MEDLTDCRWWMTSTLANGEAPRGVRPGEQGFIDGEVVNMRAIAAVIVRAAAEDGLTDAEVAELLTDVDADDVARAQVALDHVLAEVFA